MSRKSSPVPMADGARFDSRATGIQARLPAFQVDPMPAGAMRAATAASAFSAVRAGATPASTSPQLMAPRRTGLPYRI